MEVPGGQAGGGDAGFLYRAGLSMLMMGFGQARLPVIGVSIAKLPAHLAMDLIYALDRMYQPGGVFAPGVSPSPGGGGPGQPLTSTNPPPSLEEVGRMLNQRDWGRSMSYTKFNGKRPRCPPGYRWDKKRRKCVRIREY